MSKENTKAKVLSRKKVLCKTNVDADNSKELEEIRKKLTNLKVQRKMLSLQIANLEEKYRKLGGKLESRYGNIE